MPSNIITGRVSQFLSQYPPFNGLREHWLEKLALSVKVIYREEEQFIFREDDPPGEHCYVLRKGRVNLYQYQDPHNNLVDVCGEGDLFGIRAMLSGEPYKMSAKVGGEALIYSIPVSLFKELVRKNPSISQFFAFGLASGRAVLSRYRSGLLSAGEDKFRPWINADPAGLINSIPASADLLSVDPETPVREAAKKMSARKTGSVLIVDQAGKPLGIVTDTDIRNRVATGEVSVKKPVREIMSSPVITIPENFAVLRIIRKMMDAGVHHLCVTDDGTVNSRALGIISNHDLLLSRGSNPAILKKSISQCQSYPELNGLFADGEKITSDYIFSDMPIEYLNSFVTGIRDAIIVRSIELAAKIIDLPRHVDFAWIALGSEGREEQVLRTDIDNALIYRIRGAQTNVKDQLIKMGLRVNEVLFEAGFMPCRAGTMAHLPGMCLSADEWNQRFGSWIRTPEPDALLKATIFFDLRAVYGDDNLVTALKDKILDGLQKNKSFINFFAKNAIINPPPLSFFNQFVVEPSGEHKNEFDLKKRAIMPLADAARVLALNHHYLETSGTVSRYEMLAAREKQNRALYEEAKTGYDFLLKTRAQSGIRNDNDGRFIDIGQLNKIDRKVMKEIFQVIKHLQSLLNVRFQLDYFGN